MLKQLGAQDASFVYMESPVTPMHIGSLAVYERGVNKNAAAEAPLTEAQIIRYFEERLHLNPTARQRLVHVPLNLDHPYWLEDATFDLEYHIRRIALPQPADWSELFTLTERIFARPLDLDRPLWEFYVIEGLDHLEGVPPGSVALLTKLHHAAVDGTSGMHLVESIHDLAPEPTRIEPPAKPWHPDPVPNDFELMARAGFNNLLQPFRFMQVLAESTGAARKAGPEITRFSQQQPFRVPRTRFNGRVTAHRSIGTCRLQLDDVKRIRRALDGATVNDVVLAICGGGLRRYLEAKQELPNDSVVAMAPVNVRGAAEGIEAGNRVAAMFVPIGTDIADPVERLAAIRDRTSASKAMNNAIGAQLMTDYNQFVPAATAALAGRLMTSMTNAPTVPFNVSITNVPGPQVPLYFNGARMITTIGMGPLTHGMGMIMPISSYCGELTIGYTSCRDMLPDPDFFRDCIQAAFDELDTATRRAQGVAEPAPKTQIADA